MSPLACLVVFALWGLALVTALGLTRGALVLTGRRKQGDFLPPACSTAATPTHGSTARTLNVLENPPISWRASSSRASSCTRACPGSARCSRSSWARGWCSRACTCRRGGRWRRSTSASPAFIVQGTSMIALLGIVVRCGPRACDGRDQAIARAAKWAKDRRASARPSRARSASPSMSTAASRRSRCCADGPATSPTYRSRRPACAAQASMRGTFPTRRSSSTWRSSTTRARWSAPLYDVAERLRARASSCRPAPLLPCCRRCGTPPPPASPPASSSSRPRPRRLAEPPLVEPAPARAGARRASARRASAPPAPMDRRGRR